MSLIPFKEFVNFLDDWTNGDRAASVAHTFIERYQLDDVELFNTPHTRHAVRLILNRYVSDT